MIVDKPESQVEVITHCIRQEQAFTNLDIGLFQWTEDDSGLPTGQIFLKHFFDNDLLGLI